MAIMFHSLHFIRVDAYITYNGLVEGGWGGEEVFFAGKG